MNESASSGGSTAAPTGDVTRLLRRLAEGDDVAESELLDALYDDLHRRATAVMRHAPPGQTLQPTALLHEAYLRVIRSGRDEFKNRSHFLGVLVLAMKSALCDYVEAKGALKRGGDRERLLLNTGLLIDRPAVDVLDVQEALERFATIDPQAARVVEMRFWCGLTNREVAEFIGVSARTVERDWKVARAWLRRELS